MIRNKSQQRDQKCTPTVIPNETTRIIHLFSCMVFLSFITLQWLNYRNDIYITIVIFCCWLIKKYIGQKLTSFSRDYLNVIVHCAMPMLAANIYWLLTGLNSPYHGAFPAHGMPSPNIDHPIYDLDLWPNPYLSHHFPPSVVSTWNSDFH